MRRSNALDTVGAWTATDVDDDFTVQLDDQAGHGADRFLVFVTRRGFDPATRTLRRDDLRQVARTGSRAPGQNRSIPVSTSGLSGRHVLCTVWQPRTRTRRASRAVT